MWLYDRTGIDSHLSLLPFLIVFVIISSNSCQLGDSESAQCEPNEASCLEISQYGLCQLFVSLLGPVYTTTAHFSYGSKVTGTVSMDRTLKYPMCIVRITSDDTLAKRMKSDAANHLSFYVDC